MDVDLSGFKAVARTFGIRRRHIATARLRYERMVLPVTQRRRPTTSGRVLCYHSIGTDEWGVNDVSLRLFKSQLDLALALGYRFVPAATIAADRGSERDIGLTFDDGLMSVYDNAAALLEDFRIPWTLFVVCDWAEGRHRRPDLFMGWKEINELATAGVTIGSHSITHSDFGQLSETQARIELWESRRIISERTGVEVSSFAIPFGQSRNWDRDLTNVAKSIGYATIYAQTVTTRPEGTVPRTFVTRFDGARTFRAALEGTFDRWEESL